ncbi:MAG: acetylxylan esterase [Verrucomicrobiota bacterium]|nr:acetylxylan esterase [Verrucomicrobiota bacterium]
MKVQQLLLSFLVVGFGPLPAAEEIVGPWNLAALKSHVPAMQWLKQEGPIHSLTSAGEAFRGQATEVFAFFASPATLRSAAKPGAKFPGIVLIHGGGGTAFAEWVLLWAERGYAAIAMDLSGSRPPDPAFDPQTGTLAGPRTENKARTRLPRGGPNHGPAEIFASIGGDPSDDWPFHAVASVMRAHSLLRSFPEVDAERTAVTGISWGGYTTCLAASLDDRFKAAVPVYGAGFLHEGDSVQRARIDGLGDRRAAWIQEYDAGSLLPRCRVPILFVNGTNDVHNPLDSYMKSFEAVPGPRQMRIEVNMRHGHIPGWAPKEIGIFIDAHCRSGRPLPVPGKPGIEGDQVRVVCQSQTALTKAELHYTTDTGLRAKRRWKTVPATIRGSTITAPKPPAEANTWFLSITDERAAMVSTTVEIAPSTP